jgi:hypothetical protein
MAIKLNIFKYIYFFLKRKKKKREKKNWGGCRAPRSHPHGAKATHGPIVV